jgi:hypothetical protein
VAVYLSFGYGLLSDYNVGCLEWDGPVFSRLMAEMLNWGVVLTIRAGIVGQLTWDVLVRLLHSPPEGW